MLEPEREEVARACRSLAADGLVAATSGNVSLRAGDHVAITPTGGVLAELSAEQVTVIDLDGSVVDGALAPTSEAALHLGIYRDHGAGAVIHTHAPMATAVACVLDELPCIHYEMLVLGGTVRVVPFHPFGSQELADGVLAALEGRTAALLSNHGTVATGTDLDGALRATALLEWAAGLWWRASALGTPRTLDEAQRQSVIEAALRMGYGQTKEA